MKPYFRAWMGLAVWVAFVGCEPKKQAADGESGTESTPSAAVTATGGEAAKEDVTEAPAGLPDTTEVVDAVQKKAAETTAAAREAVDEMQETATEAAKDVEQAASETVDELAKVAESTFSLEKLKGLLGSLSTEDLTRTADRLLAALKDQQGIVKGLQDQIANLGIADALKAPELKKQLESALSLVGQLKGKLSSVVSTLKEKGMDVSKYTALLGG